MKILIADDETEARELIKNYLSEWSNELELLECKDGKETLEGIEAFQPDIVFLDIKMPELTGLQAISEVKGPGKPAIIFTTAFDEFSLPAFEFEAIDYLLKPLEKERFVKALKKAEDYLEFKKWKRNKNYIQAISVKKGTVVEKVPVDEIFYFEASGPYVQIITPSGSFLIAQPIYELEASLDPRHFMRIHRSVIVNTRSVRKIQSLINEDHQLTLSNGKELRASRTYKENVRKLKQEP